MVPLAMSVRLSTHHLIFKNYIMNNQKQSKWMFDRLSTILTKLQDLRISTEVRDSSGKIRDELEKGERALYKAVMHIRDNIKE